MLNNFNRHSFDYNSFYENNLKQIFVVLLIYKNVKQHMLNLI